MKIPLPKLEPIQLSKVPTVEKQKLLLEAALQPPKDGAIAYLGHTLNRFARDWCRKHYYARRAAEKTNQELPNALNDGDLEKIIQSVKLISKSMVSRLKQNTVDSTDSNHSLLWNQYELKQQKNIQKKALESYALLKRCSISSIRAVISNHDPIIEAAEIEQFGDKYARNRVQRHQNAETIRTKRGGISRRHLVNAHRQRDISEDTTSTSTRQKRNALLRVGKQNEPLNPVITLSNNFLTALNQWIDHSMEVENENPPSNDSDAETSSDAQVSTHESQSASNSPNSLNSSSSGSPTARQQFSTPRGKHLKSALAHPVTPFSTKNDLDSVFDLSLLQEADIGPEFIELIINCLSNITKYQNQLLNQIERSRRLENMAQWLQSNKETAHIASQAPLNVTGFESDTSLSLGDQTLADFANSVYWASYIANESPNKS